MEKILITGVNGFVGHHVANQLHERDFVVIGLGNQPTLQPDLEGIVDKYVTCDLTNPDEVKNIDMTVVGSVINLAGFASVGDSFGQAELYKKVNIGVHTNLYQECLRQSASPRIIAVSTGAVYDSTQPMPITEGSKLVDHDKTNAYVVSKQLMEQEVSKFNELGLNCLIVRPFNHTGPGQLPGFLLPDLYEQMIDSAHENKPLLVGNLDTKRDFTDVRDVARAYVDLATCESKKLNSEVYNICSGKSVSGKEIFEILSSCLGFNNLDIQIDRNKIRENEIMDIYGSNQKLADDIKWSPTIKLKDTIKDFVLWKQST